jgi:hypothetical protein
MLFYFGTNIEVKIGDKIQIKRFLRRPQEATVCYIPGISRRHSELEVDDVRQWAFRTDDGTVYPVVYDPANFQPPRYIRFLERTPIAGITPEEELR